ncbi:MAG: hypothetical protein ACT4O6_22105 [Reyranella sp.]
MLLIGVTVLGFALVALWLGLRGFFPLLAKSYAASAAFSVVVAFSLMFGFGLTVVNLF